MSSNDERCECCNGRGVLYKCLRCGEEFAYTNKYSSCDSPSCDGERSREIPCPVCKADPNEEG